MKLHPAGRITRLVLATVICFQVFVTQAVPPGWWGARQVMKTDSGDQPLPAQDFAVANQGQLKKVATAAYEELLEKIPASLGGIGNMNPPGQSVPNGGTGWQIRHLLENWGVQFNADGTLVRENGQVVVQRAASFSTVLDFAVLRQGQLKATAKPFYRRLREIYGTYGYAFPWTDDDNPATTSDTQDDRNNAVANLGQLKFVFSFDLDQDRDGDGISDLDELVQGSNPSDATMPVPGSLTVGAIEGTKFHLTWSATANGISGFLIERMTGLGASAKWQEIDRIPVVLTTAGASQSRDDYAIFPGVTYAYRVRAYAGNRISEPSNVATIMLPRVLVAGEAANEPKTDTDGDGLTDLWEAAHNLDATDPNDAMADSDGDGISNLAAYLTPPASTPQTIAIRARSSSGNASQPYVSGWFIESIGSIESVPHATLNPANGDLVLETVGTGLSDHDKLGLVFREELDLGAASVCLKSIGDGRGDAEGGLHVRASLSDGAVSAGVTVDKDGHVRFIYRSVTGGDSVQAGIATVSPVSNIYLKIEYSPSAAFGYYSLNGTNWIKLGAAFLTQNGLSNAGKSLVGVGGASGVNDADTVTTFSFGSYTFGDILPPPFVQSNLRAWYRATDADLAADKVTVTSLKDGSATGFALTPGASAPKRIIDASTGRPALRFEGNATLSSPTSHPLVAGSADNEATVFAVAGFEGDELRQTKTYPIWNFGTPTAGLSLTRNVLATGVKRLTLKWSGGSKGSLTPSPGKAGQGVFALVKNATTSKFFRNKGLVDLATRLTAKSKLTAGLRAAGTITLGGNGCFHGSLQEVMVFDRALSDFERGQVEDYLLLRNNLLQAPDAPASSDPYLSWAYSLFGTTAGIAARNQDPDADGFTNEQEFNYHTDPRDFYNDEAPQVSIVAGNQQILGPDGHTPMPFTVKVTSFNGTPFRNAPVSFTVTSGDLMLAPEIGDPADYDTQVSVTTDSTGIAQVWGYCSSNAPLGPFTVAADAEYSLGTVSAEFAGKSEAWTVPDPEKLAIWLRPDRGVVADSFGRVKTWVDQRGRGVVFQQKDDVKKPIFVNERANGFGSIQFDGTDDLLTTAATDLGDELTIIAVTSSGQSIAVRNFGQSTQSTSATIFGTETYGFNLARGSDLNGDTDRFGLGWSSTRTTIKPEASAVHLLPTPQVLSAVKTLTRIRVLRDGTELADNDLTSTTGPISTPRKQFGLGARPLGEGIVLKTAFVGEVFELLVYQGTLSEHDRRSLEASLAVKYGIQDHTSIPSAGLVSRHRIALDGEAETREFSTTVSPPSLSGWREFTSNPSLKLAPFLAFGRPIRATDFWTEFSSNPIRSGQANDLLKNSGEATAFVVFRNTPGAASATGLPKIVDAGLAGFRLGMDGTGDTAKYTLETNHGGSASTVQLGQRKAEPVLLSFKSAQISPEATAQLMHDEVFLNGIHASDVPRTARLAPFSQSYLEVGGFNGAVAEVIIYNRRLEASEFEAVEDYLARRYNLAPFDRDGNGLPDEWEKRYGFYQASGNQSPDGDFDNDGVSNRLEFTNGTDPTDYFNGHIPGLSVASGNLQTGLVGQVLAHPLSVLVTANEQPLNHAPVVFEVVEGRGQLVRGEEKSRRMVVEADANGLAAISFQLSSQNDLISKIRVTPLGYSDEPEVYFYATPPSITLPPTPGLVHTLARGGVFARGVGLTPHQSYVLPLDSQTGLALPMLRSSVAPGGGNALSVLYPSTQPPFSLPWFASAIVPSTGNLVGPENSLRAHLVVGASPNCDVQYPSSGTGSEAFDLPIVGFGSASGGGALFSGESYRFAVYAGAVDVDSPTPPEVFRLHVFAKGADNALPLETLSFKIPRPGVPAEMAEWNEFARNGFTISRSSKGLTTTVQMLFGEQFFAAVGDGQSNLDIDSANLLTPEKLAQRVGEGVFIVKHFATADAADYRFVLEGFGTVSVPGSSTSSVRVPMVQNPALPTVRAGDLLYALNFDVKSPWRATFIDSTSFESTTAPQAYAAAGQHGLTAPVLTFPDAAHLLPATFAGAELTTVRAPDSAPTSPEFRRHSQLDSLLRNLTPYYMEVPSEAARFALTSDDIQVGGRVLQVSGSTEQVFKLVDDENINNAAGWVAVKKIDALDLINYVTNEIELTDFLAAGANTSTPKLAWNSVNRGAAATLLEGRGSPVEQCALLVYLLREAGYRATYVFPKQADTLRHAENEVRRLLKFAGIVGTGPDRVVNLNYPWVAVYEEGTGWHYAFPWLKDNEVHLGRSPYDFLPEAYSTGRKFAEKYLYGEYGLLNLSELNTPRTIFPALVSKSLESTSFSVDDIGLRVSRRKANPTHWSDLPRPSTIQGDALAFDNLKEVGIYLAGETGAEAMFNEVTFAVTRSDGSILPAIPPPGTPPSDDLAISRPLRTLDIHNRALLAYFTVGASRLQVELGAFDDSQENLISDLANAVLQLDGTTDARQVVTIPLKAANGNSFVVWPENVAGPLPLLNLQRVTKEWPVDLVMSAGVAPTGKITSPRSQVLYPGVNAIALTSGQISDAMLEIQKAQLQQATVELNVRIAHRNGIAGTFNDAVKIYNGKIAQYNATARKLYLDNQFLALALSKSIPDSRAIKSYNQRVAADTSKLTALTDYLNSHSPPIDAAFDAADALVVRVAIQMQRYGARFLASTYLKNRGDAEDILGRFHALNKVSGHEAIVAAMMFNSKRIRPDGYIKQPRIVLDACWREGTFLNAGRMSLGVAGAIPEDTSASFRWLNEMTASAEEHVAVDSYFGIRSSTISTVTLLQDAERSAGPGKVGIVYLNKFNVSDPNPPNAGQPNASLQMVPSASSRTQKAPLRDELGVLWSNCLQGELRHDRADFVEAFVTPGRSALPGQKLPPAAAFVIAADGSAGGAYLSWGNFIAGGAAGGADEEVWGDDSGYDEVGLGYDSSDDYYYSDTFWDDFFDDPLQDYYPYDNSSDYQPDILGPEYFVGQTLLIYSYSNNMDGLVSLANFALYLDLNASSAFVGSIHEVRITDDSEFGLRPLPNDGTLILKDPALSVSNFADTVNQLQKANAAIADRGEHRDLQSTHVEGGAFDLVHSSLANIMATAAAQINNPLFLQRAAIPADATSSPTTDLTSTPRPSVTYAADPVNIMTGAFDDSNTDLTVAGPFPFALTRRYSSLQITAGPLGYGWTPGLVPYLTWQIAPPGHAAMPPHTTTHWATALADESNMLGHSEPVLTLTDLESKRVKKGTQNDFLPYRLFIPEDDSSVVAYDYQGNNRWQPTRQQNRTVQNSGSATDNPFESYVQFEPGIDTSQADRWVLHRPDGSKKTYMMAEFPLDRNVKYNRRRPYLEKWEDARGQALKFEYGCDPKSTNYGQLVRVTLSNGNSMGFQYNSEGHIASAFSSDGRWVYYDYNDFGDLKKVTYPDGSETTYKYQIAEQMIGSTRLATSDHLIRRVINPNGRVVENDYDTFRRVVEQRTAVGKDGQLVRTAAFQYKIQRLGDERYHDGTVIMRDAKDHATTYLFVKGLLCETENAVGDKETLQWFDSVPTALVGAGQAGSPPLTDFSKVYPRSLARSWTSRGLETRFQYDAHGNITGRIVRGNLTGSGVSTRTESMEFETIGLDSITHVGLSRLKTATSPIGDGASSAVKTIVYGDSSSPLLPTSITETASGVAVRQTNIVYYGGTTAIRGLPKSVTTYSPLAFATDKSVSEFTYDHWGFLASSLSRAGSAPSSADRKSIFVSDARGKVLESRDAMGRSTFSSYNAMGQRISTETRDENGHALDRRSFYYNENGDLICQDGPMSGPEDYVWFQYDGDGRMTSKTRARSKGQISGGTASVIGETGDDAYASDFISYDSLGNADAIVDPRHNSTRMSYDAVNRLLARVRMGSSELGGKTMAAEQFAYGPDNLVTEYTSPLGAVTKTQYTDTGKPIRVDQYSAGENSALTFQETRYYADGRLKMAGLPNQSLDGASAVHWLYTYSDQEHKVTRQLKSGNGIYATEVVVTDSRGNPISQHWEGVQDVNVPAAGPALFINSSATYDWLGRPLTVTMPLGRTMTYAYDQVQGTITTTQSYTDSATSPATTVIQRIVSKTDALGRPVQTQLFEKRGTAAERLINQTSTKYPFIGTDDTHLVSSTSGTGTTAVTTSTYFDSDGLPVIQRQEGDGAMTLNQYDAVGNLLSSTDAAGRRSINLYDGLNRPEARILPDNGRIYLTYDAAGNVLEQVLPTGVQTKSTFDSLGRLTFTEQRNQGASTKRKNLHYYPADSPFAGMLSSIQEHLEAEVTVDHSFFYNPLLGLKSTSVQKGNEIIATEMLRDARGFTLKTTQINSVGGQETYRSVIDRAFDYLGRDTSETVSLGITGGTPAIISSLAQDWNEATQRTSLSTQSTLLSQSPKPSFGYSYRSDGTLETVKATIGGTARSFSYSYSDQGLLQDVGSNKARVSPWRSVSIPSRDGNGRAPTTLTYGASGSTPILSEQITFTPWKDSKISTYTRTTTGSPELWQYGYDGGGLPNEGRSRLTSETPPGILGVPPLSYGFDFGQPGGLGILTSAQSSSSAFPLSRMEVTTDQGVDAFGRVVEEHLNGQAVTNHYDERGGLTSRNFANGSSQTFTWDALGRLVKVNQPDGSEWRAWYDALNRRTRTEFTTGGSTQRLDSIYDPEVEFLEIALSATEFGQSTRVWKIYGPDGSGVYGGAQGAGGLEALVEESTGEAKGIINDVHGSVAGFADQADFYFQTTRYGAYGPLPGSTSAQPQASLLLGSLSQALGWQGRRMDPTGLYYFGARYYDPEAGRFISPDPLGHASSLSLYDFCNGDPLNYWDPDGRCRTAAEKIAAESHPSYDQANSIADAYRGHLLRDYGMTDDPGDFRNFYVINNGINGLRKIDPGLSLAEYKRTYNEWKSWSDVAGKILAGQIDAESREFNKTAIHYIGIGAMIADYIFGSHSGEGGVLVEKGLQQTLLNFGREVTVKDAATVAAEREATVAAETAGSELAAAEKNLGSVPARKTVAADQSGQRTLSGWTDTEGFVASKAQVSQVMEKAEEIGFEFKPHIFDNGVRGRYFASHAEPQLSLKSDIFAVSKKMCESCRSFVSGSAVAKEKTFIIQDPTKIWTFSPTSTSWVPR